MLGKNIATSGWITGLLLCGAVGVSACAPARPPIAYRQPIEAAAELQLARDGLARARLALDAREYEQARRLADQALADVRLAESRAVTESARETAHDLRLSITSVREEAERALVASIPPPPLPPTELRLAREALDDARVALDARAYERAYRLATQAIADARTAEARAATESMRQAAREVRLSSETLRDSAARLAALY